MAYWLPSTGKPLPRASEAIGVRRKLAYYSLDMTNQFGKPKAEGFARILHITIDDIDYLEATISAAVITAPVTSVRDCAPYGFNAVVEIPVRGLREKSERVINVRTVWRLAGPSCPPRLTTAFPRP
jgi:Domain of unknown function (DUF6883)